MTCKPVRSHHPRRWVMAGLALLALPWLSASAGPPIFDAHLHYRPAMLEAFPPNRVAETFAENHVEGALIAAPRADLIQALEAATQVHIVPFLAISQRLGRKMDWMHAEDLIEETVAVLESTDVDWRGIGELHILADERFAPGFEALLELAVERDLYVMIHGDPAVIDHAYAIQPEVRILWAHAGSFAYPPLLEDYLERHPRMHMDLSMRNPRINRERTTDVDWFELFLAFPDRFMIGVDTFSLNRWEEFTRLEDATRAWLDQLPEDVARAIAYDNAERLFPPR
ncbi:MAG: amidohydrolase family protein [Pseudomonadota bacterium]